MSIRKFPQIVLWAILYLVLLIGCGCAQQSDTSSTLRRGITGSVESLDPHRFSTKQSATVIRDLREGLFGYTASGELQPIVAREWEVSEDGQVYRIHIHDDMQWSNGKSVTANDFVNGLRRLVSPATASPSAGKVKMIKGAADVFEGRAQPDALAVKAVGKFELQIELERATSYFLELLAHPSTFPIYVQPRGSLDDVDLSIGNGPYVVIGGVAGSSIELRQNRHYWDVQNVWFNAVHYHMLEPAAELRMYRAGHIDITDSVPSEMFALMKEERPGELMVSPSLGVYYYGFNLTREPFKDNPELRLALSLAIDRAAIVETVLGRGELVADSLVPPGIPQYPRPDLSHFGLTQAEREVKAKQLFEQAGYGPENPLEVELRYNTGGAHGSIAVAVQYMWQDVLGVTTELVAEEFGPFITNVQAMNVTEVFRLSWAAEFQDPRSFLQLFESDNPNNLTGYSRAEVDSALGRAEDERTSSSRLSKLAVAEELALKDTPLMPLYFMVNLHMVSPDIDGFESNVLNIHYSKHFRKADESAQSAQN